MKSHRETYPEQYTHRLCGRPVRVIIEGNVRREGVVRRVITSARFGPLVILEGSAEEAWAIANVKEANEEEQ